MQVCTQRYGRRPYGVGMLVAGYDVSWALLGGGKHCVNCNLLFQLLQTVGPHLYQTCPSSNYYDCKAMAIGARSQVGESSHESLASLISYSISNIHCSQQEPTWRRILTNFQIVSSQPLTSLSFRVHPYGTCGSLKISYMTLLGV